MEEASGEVFGFSRYKFPLHNAVILSAAKDLRLHLIALPQNSTSVVPQLRASVEGYGLVGRGFNPDSACGFR
jgi:hypothetical protein